MTSSAGRRTAAELEEMVLEAGVEIALNEGLGLGCESITYARVFRHLEDVRGERVTRASVHERIWPDQAAYQAALRTRLAHYRISPEIEMGRAVIQDALGPALETMPVGVVARELVRQLGEIDVSSFRSDTDDPGTDLPYRAGLVVKGLATLASEEQRAENPALVEAVADGLDELADAYTALYTDALDRMGLQMRPEVNLERHEAIRLIARATNAMADGLEQRYMFDREPLYDIPLSIDGEDPEEWTLISMMGYALMRLFFDIPDEPVGTPDPD